MRLETTSTPMRLAWPLTGRFEEMRIVTDILSDPELAGVVVRGAAGVGKSRIAREALSAAAAKGCQTHWVVGTSSARSLPLGAFASWTSSGESDNLQLTRSVIESLTAAEPGTTVVVGVDDVHLLDDLSTFVLHQLVHRHVVKMVLTVRDGEPISAGARELWHGGRFERLDLLPLSELETTTLLSASLGGSVDPVAARELWQLTRGNPLYLRNIVEQEIGNGRLAQHGGCWRWTGQPVVPPELVEMIEARMGALPAPVCDVLDVLAVGEPLELESLQRITDPAAVEDADTRGLIAIDHVDGRVEVRVAHPLYGEVRRNRAPTIRLRRLRGLVVNELAQSDRGDDMRTIVRRASLSLDSDITPDPHLLLQAARGAVWLADLLLAERLADAAIRAGADVEANFVRSHALFGISRGEEADAVLTGIPAARLTDANRARVAFARACNMIWPLADPTLAKKLIDEASREVASTARDCVGAALAVYWAATGHPSEARKALERVAVEELPEIQGALTAWAATISSGQAGLTSEAVTAAEAGYSAADRVYEAAHTRFVVADGHVGALLLAGRTADAQEAARRLGQQAAYLPAGPQLSFRAVAGRAALGAGRPHTACALLEPVISRLSAAGDRNGWPYRYRLPYTIALAMQGLLDEASAALAAVEEEPHPGWACFDYERELARAWIAAAQDRVTQAIGTLLTAAETAREKGQLAPEVVCLQTAAQFGDYSGAARLRELTQIVEGPRVSVAARFADALRRDDGAELLRVSEEFEQIGDIVAAIDAAAHAAGGYGRQGLRGSRYGATSRAEALADRCEGVSTPALRGVTQRLPLTSREREVVLMIGDGMSNRAIASRLSVSVRTVEGHIYRAMAKTGATNREELAATVLRRH